MPRQHAAKQLTLAFVSWQQLPTRLCFASPPLQSPSSLTGRPGPRSVASAARRFPARSGPHLERRAFPRGVCIEFRPVHSCLEQSRGLPGGPSEEERWHSERNVDPARPQILVTSLKSGPSKTYRLHHPVHENSINFVCKSTTRVKPSKVPKTASHFGELRAHKVAFDER